MKLHIAMLAIGIVTALSIAGGGRPNGDEGMPQYPDDETNGVIGDTSVVEGTVGFVSEENKMLVIRRTFGEDTIYYTDQTIFAQDSRDMVLRQGAEVRVWYITMDDRKIAIQIGPQE